MIVLLGLILSDAWKYWIGSLAHTHPKMRAMAEKKKVVAMGDRIKANAILTLLLARFVPFARIPSYIACGYFKVPYWKFLLSITLSGFAYVSIIFIVAHYLSEIFGDKLEIILPTFGLVLLVIVGIVWLIKRLTKKPA